MNKTTIDFLNSIKEKFDITSNYGLARKLDQTDTDIARWMKGKNTLGDEAALKVADLLDLDPAYVLACVHAERAKTEPEKAIWQRIANMATDHPAIAAALFAVTVLPFVSSDQMQLGLIALSAAPTSEGLYIMSNGILTYWPVFLALFALMLWAFLPHHPHPQKSQDNLTK